MMMATRPAISRPPAPGRSKPSTRAFASSPRPASRFSRLTAYASPRSADLAGRAVALSPDIPGAFDVPLAAHHKMIGRWAAARANPADRFSRPEIRRFIERAFDEAVMEALAGFTLADLRVCVLLGDSANLPPAIAIICDSVGQIDLGWIEKSNTLSTTLFERVAPVGWRAAAYKTLGEVLPAALPVFGYADLVEELSAYHWDGETDDEGARRAMIDYLGHDADDVEASMLPSHVEAKRPEWMLEHKAAPLKDMPANLADRIRRVRAAHKALKAADRQRGAWHAEFDETVEYLPGCEDCSHLAPLTLVPFDVFARELDDVAQHGMQLGFMDTAGLRPLTDATSIDDWFASLKLGADLLRAAQDLIDFDPAKS